MSEGSPRPFGRYLLQRELGRGSYGAVYLATRPDLGRRFALKVLLDPAIRDREALADGSATAGR